MRLQEGAHLTTKGGPRDYQKGAKLPQRDYQKGVTRLLIIIYVVESGQMP